MDVFSFIQLFGGLAFFLFGMNLLSGSLEKMTGGKLEKLLKKATDNKFKGLAIGAIITIAIQSSSAMTVMLVGFVNSGIMDLGQTIGVIFGSDIGTTLTAWILSLAGIDSGGSIILGLLKPKNFSLIFALIGVIMTMMGKTQKKKDAGNMLLGFAVLMTGMTMMSSSMDPLAESESFRSMLTAFNNPLLGVLVGTVITGVIQSSAASIGMIQSLSLTGALTWGMSIPLIMGANIGTCMTAILSCIGVNRNAKRVSVVHVSVKIIGTIFWLIVFYGLNAVLHFDFMQQVIGPLGVAGAHSIFNILTVLILFPCSSLLEKLAMRIIKDKREDKEIFLDERLMTTPSFAIAECGNSMRRMIARVEVAIELAVETVKNGFVQEKYDKIMKNEDKIDSYEDLIGAYIMKLS
ncbi:MAG: Na/Pi cotransporter family protein, partial [Lachnospiraceae bacterium]